MNRRVDNIRMHGTTVKKMSVQLYCSPDISNMLSNMKDKYTADCQCGMFSFNYA